VGQGDQGREYRAAVIGLTFHFPLRDFGEANVRFGS
jgi:hypothetical protein